MKETYTDRFLDPLREVWKLLTMPEVHGVVAMVGLVFIGMLAVVKLGFLLHILPR